MAQFVVVDHSLKGEGGHHLDYDCNVLLAAERAGYSPILATHRRFRSRSQLPSHWPVFPVFRHHAYSRYSILTGKARYPVLVDEQQATDQDRPPAPGDHRSPGLWASLRRRWRRWQIERRWNHFASACRQLFERVPLQAGDQVFFPTMTEFDLVGLARFLQTFPHRGSADWHVLFHHGFLHGRGDEFAEQAPVFAAMQSHFAQIRDLLGDSRLHCHATTLPLARQYASLGVLPCHRLDYAVTTSPPQVVESADTAPHPGPLRFALAGGVRAEKGHSHLAQIVAELQRHPALASRCQFWVQSKHALSLNGAEVFDVSLEALREGRVPGDPLVVRIPHPLADVDYRRLFTQVDVGLFLHDPRRYLSRCSGVLVEMLAAGLPVIVPAGCWLADEFAPAANRRWQQILDDSAQCGEPGEGEGTLDIRVSTEETVIELRVPPKAGYLLLEYPAHGARAVCARREDELEECVAASGSLHAVAADACATVNAQQYDHGQVGIRRWGVWFESPRDRVSAKGLVPIHPFAKRITLTWRFPALKDAAPAQGRGPIEVSYRFRRDARAQAMPGPASDVGITALDLDDLVEQFDEITRHFPHYRETARRFGRDYAHAHHPDRVVERLAAVAASRTDRRGK